MTLIEELEQAAKRAEDRARRCDADASDDPRLGGRTSSGPHWIEAARLRKRVEHVKRLGLELSHGHHPLSTDADLFNTLTGDL